MINHDQRKLGSNTSELRMTFSNEGWCAIYNTLDEGWCDTLQHRTMDCNEGWCDTVHHITRDCNEGRCDTLHHITIDCNERRCNERWCDQRKLGSNLPSYGQLEL